MGGAPIATYISPSLFVGCPSFEHVHADDPQEAARLMHERNVVAVPTLEVARAALVLVSSEEWAHRHLTVLGLEGRDAPPSDDARDHTP